MSVMGNAAIKGEMKRLLRLLEEIKDKPAQEQLAELRQHIEQTIQSADGGWL